MSTSLSATLVALGATVPIPVPDLTSGDWGQTLLVVAVAGISALLTYLGVKRKAHAQERVASVETQATTTQAGLEVLIENLKSRLEKVEEELRDMRGVNRSLELTNLQLNSAVKTKDDVIEAFATVLVAWEDWYHAGFPDPPGRPGYTWQVRHYMQDLADAVKQSTEASQRLQQELEGP